MNVKPLKTNQLKQKKLGQQVNLDLKNKTNMDIDDSYFSYVGRMLSRN